VANAAIAPPALPLWIRVVTVDPGFRRVHCFTTQEAAPNARARPLAFDDNNKAGSRRS